MNHTMSQKAAWWIAAAVLVAVIVFGWWWYADRGADPGLPQGPQGQQGQDGTGPSAIVSDEELSGAAADIDAELQALDSDAAGIDQGLNDEPVPVDQ